MIGDTSASDFSSLENVVIIGTGLMGAGIAQVAVESGLDVTMVGRSEEKCNGTRQKVLAGVQKSTKKRMGGEPAEKQQQIVEASMRNLHFVTELEEANLAGADMVGDFGLKTVPKTTRRFAGD